MTHIARMPDFFLIGAAKSGTTSLWNYLDQHPGIFMCKPKEPSFMAWGEQPWPYTHPTEEEFMRGIKWPFTREGYCQLFAGAAPHQRAGEASVSSIFEERAAGRIRHYAPEARIIAILRQPADRAFSHYAMMLRDGTETVNDFGRVLALEPERMQKGWIGRYFHFARGRYAEQLARYFDLFDRSRIKVFLYDDLLADAAGVMRALYQFLEVDDAFLPDVSRRMNEGGTRPVHAAWFKALRDNKLTAALRNHAQPIYQPIKNAANAVMTKPAVLDPALRDELTQDYRDDILRLQDMIDRDLSHWLAPTSKRG
jgi:hypothetical protein